MPEMPLHTAAILPLKGIGDTAKLPFRYEPDTVLRDALKRDFGLLGLKKVRLHGDLTPAGQKDWQLKATLGATVVQPCVVTLDPVTTRIDAPLVRLFMADPPAEPEAAEAEMPEDDTIEPLPEVLDLAQLLTEALALALPDFPRADHAEDLPQTFTEPGKSPMTDEEARPFSALKGLIDPSEGSDSDT